MVGTLSVEWRHVVQVHRFRDGTLLPCRDDFDGAVVPLDDAITTRLMNCAEPLPTWP